MSFSLDQFLKASSEVAKDVMKIVLPQQSAEYPMIILQGISQIEHEYYFSLPDFIKQERPDNNHCPLCVETDGRVIMLGYTAMALKTFLRLATLKDRPVYIIPEPNVRLPVEDRILMQFICQDTKE